MGKDTDQMSVAKTATQLKQFTVEDLLPITTLGAGNTKSAQVLMDVLNPIIDKINAQDKEQADAYKLIARVANSCLGLVTRVEELENEMSAMRKKSLR